MEIFYDILKLVVVGVISGLFSAFLANRKHRNQKWWELRVMAYKEVIEALSDLIYYYDTNCNAEIEHKEHRDEFQKKLSGIWGKSYHKVRKSADSGAFLFSTEVNDALVEFIATNKEKPNTYFEFLDNNLFVAKKCLKTINKAARKDLKI